MQLKTVFVWEVKRLLDSQHKKCLIVIKQALGVRVALPTEYLPGVKEKDLFLRLVTQRAKKVR